jgi:hypothetical protein
MLSKRYVGFAASAESAWIPAFAGTTVFGAATIVNAGGSSTVMRDVNRELLSHMVGQCDQAKNARFGSHPIAGQVSLGYNLEV